MNRVTQIWQTLSYLGLTSEEIHSRREIVLLNKINVVALLMVVSFIPVELMLNGIQLVPVEVASAAVFSFGLYCTKKRWFTFAKYYGIIVSTLLIYLMTFLVGGYSNSEFMLFAILLLPVILFKQKQHIFIMSCAIVVAFYGLKYTYPNVPAVVDLPLELKLKVQPIINLMTMIMLFAGVYYFKSINNSFETKLKLQKEEIEESHLEIQSSINYAKRIQEALLPQREKEREFLPDHFIIYKPKDVVSGDFYWTQQKGDFIYIAAGDCTGHGVPGGFLTMLAISFLNEIKLGETLTPAQILDKLRDKIVDELSQKRNSNRDGLDISLARYNANEASIEWAGANNPLYILRNEEFIMTRGDREPIGYTDNPTPFTNHKFSIEKGDLVYLFSDGFADQFGGADGKKMGYKKMREKLLEVSALAMNVQKEQLSTFFEDWKAQEDQVDDVCLISIKI